jgi:hypothetical protein
MSRPKGASFSTEQLQEKKKDDSILERPTGNVDDWCHEFVTNFQTMQAAAKEVEKERKAAGRSE